MSLYSLLIETLIGLFKDAGFEMPEDMNETQREEFAFHALEYCKLLPSDEYERLTAAAHSVVSAWETSKLAECVRGLDQALKAKVGETTTPRVFIICQGGLVQEVVGLSKQAYEICDTDAFEDTTSDEAKRYFEKLSPKLQTWLRASHWRQALPVSLRNDSFASEGNMKDEVIEGSLDIGLLEKADRVFDNDDRSVFVELLQNARRAGAKSVAVSIQETGRTPGECQVTVQDDGAGIHKFQNLVTLGKSGWDNDTKRTEDPAGMGFFALCLSGVEVASGYRSVTITREVFLGKAKAQTQTSAAYVSGTRLRFVRQSDKRALARTLEDVTEFYPLEVRLDGVLLPSHNFLDGAIHREIIDGVEVGFATEFVHPTTCVDANWNFYGLTIRHAFPDIYGIVRQNENRALALRAKFNVIETGRITLKLPDRSSVVKDDFLKQFEQKALAAAYRCFQKESCHVLAFKNWQEAHDLGIVLPEAASLLATWAAPPADDSAEPLFGDRVTGVVPDLRRAIIVQYDLPNAHTLQGALHSGAILENDLYTEDPRYSGYSWYDALPRLIDTAIRVDGMPWDESPQFTSENRPFKIEVVLTLSQRGQSDRFVALPAQIHVDSEEVNSASFVAVKPSPWDKDDSSGPFPLREFIVWATFRSSDDWENDSWQTQLDQYQEEVEEELNEYFRGPRANLLVLLKKLSLDANRLACRAGVTEMTLRRAAPNSHEWDIQLSGANGLIES
jgi:hypothetical protein